MQYKNQLFKCYSSSLAPPCKCSITSSLSFRLVWYVTPLLVNGVLTSSDSLFQQVDHEKKHKNTAYAWPIATISRNTCSIVASSGFYQSPGPSPLGNLCDIVPAHHHGHQHGQQSWSISSLLFSLLLPWQLLGQYGASSCPMVGSSGFRGSPGHATLGGAVCIALAHRRGHQSSLWMRYIHSLLPTFFLSLLIAKDHVMVN